VESWQRIDRAADTEARALLHACCGATRWVHRMMARRPFGSREAALEAARTEWFSLSREDWLEAFAQHPRIGDIEGLRKRFPQTRHLAAREQAGVAEAGEEILTGLAEANREYEQKFGYIFIVCATGKTAEEMLGLLRARLTNEPATEIRVAAREQAKITAIRLTNA
jgi:2-oxo-4-hydroxy-4-carboxy-5-ureidoimidazoline decarboxylase